MPTPAVPIRTLALHAPAKINLGLHVLRRREDGFHDIDTAMLRVGWSDHLVVRDEGAGVTLSCSDPSLPTDSRNLVVRAAEALLGQRADGPGRPGLHFHLDKRIPHGAGLGGGSSDAAAALTLLALAEPGAFSSPDLHAAAAAVGSDVPFFLEAGAQRATGRGERLEPLLFADGRPYRLPFSLALVMPDVAVPTAGAYSLVTPDGLNRPDLAAVVRSNDLDRWRRELVNDFQVPIAARHPEIVRALARMEHQGAGYAAMTGSGAAVFGVFEHPGDAQAAAEEAIADGLRAYWE